MLRAVVAGVFVAITTWFQIASGGDWSGTPNQALSDRAALLRAMGDPAAMLVSYPPLTTLLAVILPGGPFVLGLVGSLLAGILIQSLAESLGRKGYGVRMIPAIALALAISPLWAYSMSTNLAAALGLTAFGLGMIDLVRFVTYANTQAGFRAGLWFAVSAFSDAATTVSALAASLAAVLLVQSRPHARLAHVFVVAFPSISVFFSFLLLSLAFGQGAYALFGGEFGWDPERWASFAAYLQTPAGWAYLAPTVLFVGAAIALGFAATGLIGLGVSLAMALSFLFGLTAEGGAGETFVLLALLAASIVPERGTSRTRIPLLLFTIAFWSVGWVDALGRSSVAAWLRTLGGLS